MPYFQETKLNYRNGPVINRHAHKLNFLNTNQKFGTAFANALKSNFHTSALLNEIIDERKVILDDKSKVEEFVEHQRKKRELNSSKMQVVGEKLQDAFIFMPEKPASVSKKEEKLPLTERIKKEILHYYNGFRLLYLDCKVAAKLLWRVLNGETLLRRERRQVFWHISCLVSAELVLKCSSSSL